MQSRQRHSWTIIIITILIIFSIDTLRAQSDLKLREGLLTELIDLFVTESISKFDSIGVKNKDAGLIVIDLLKNDPDLLPGSMLENPSYRTKDQFKLSYEVKILLMFDCELMGPYIPSARIQYKGRPIIFFTALSGLFEYNFKDNFSWKKKIHKHCATNTFMMWWRVRLNADSKTPILILEKHTTE